MNDLISRKAAIDALGERPIVWSNDDEYALGERSQYDIDRLAIETVPSAQPEPNDNAKVKAAYKHGKSKGVKKGLGLKQRWIPCSERLPNSQTEVIVSCRDDSADIICRYTASGWITTDGKYWIVDNEINSYVIAWMPLPEPFREEGGE